MAIFNEILKKSLFKGHICAKEAELEQPKVLPDFQNYDLIVHCTQSLTTGPFEATATGIQS